MLKISKFGQITVSRGDSFRAPLFLNSGTEYAPVRYELGDSDKLYFALMEPNQRFEDAILKRIYDKNSEKTEYNDTYICIYPTDTENLIPGTYYYTIKLVTEVFGGPSQVATVVPETEFYISR